MYSLVTVPHLFPHPHVVLSPFAGEHRHQQGHQQQSGARVRDAGAGRRVLPAGGGGPGYALLFLSASLSLWLAVYVRVGQGALLLSGMQTSMVVLLGNANLCGYVARLISQQAFGVGGSLCACALYRPFCFGLDINDRLPLDTV